MTESLYEKIVINSRNGRIELDRTFKNLYLHNPSKVTGQIVINDDRYIDPSEVDIIENVPGGITVISWSIPNPSSPITVFLSNAFMKPHELVFKVEEAIPVDVTTPEINVNLTNGLITIIPEASSIFTIQPKAGSIFSVDITNSLLDVNITNSLIYVDQVSNSVWDINVTNSSLNVNVQNSSLDVNVTNSVIGVNVTNSVITVDQALDSVWDINVTNSVLAVDVQNSVLNVNVNNSVITVDQAADSVWDINVTNSVLAVNIQNTLLDVNITNSVLDVSISGTASVSIDNASISIQTVTEEYSLTGRVTPFSASGSTSENGTGVTVLLYENTTSNNTYLTYINGAVRPKYYSGTYYPSDVYTCRFYIQYADDTTDTLHTFTFNGSNLSGSQEFNNYIQIPPGASIKVYFYMYNPGSYYASAHIIV